MISTNWFDFPLKIYLLVLHKVRVEIGLTRNVSQIQTVSQSQIDSNEIVWKVKIEIIGEIMNINRSFWSICSQKDWKIEINKSNSVLENRTGR